MVECTVFTCPQCGRERPFPGDPDAELAERRFRLGVERHMRGVHGVMDEDAPAHQEAMATRRRVDVDEATVEQVENSSYPNWDHWGIGEE